MKIYKYLFLVLSTLVSSTVFSQEEVVAEVNSDYSIYHWLYENIILVIGGVVIVLVFASLLRLAFSLLSLQKARLMKEMGIEKEEVLQELRQPFWSKAYDWAWSYVPIAEESDIDLGHDYDGIRELDNKLPPWWLILFYGTIAFAAIYMYIYHWSGSEWSSEQEYYASIELAEEQIKEYLAQQADAVDETNVTFLTDENTLLAGESIFIGQCAVCHGQNGEGLVGPNFTDQYWVKGGGVKNIFTTIKYGVPEKGMISWKSQLRPSEMQSVASYIMTLEGTDPPNQKAPEGELWTETEEVPVLESSVSQ